MKVTELRLRNFVGTATLKKGIRIPQYTNWFVIYSIGFEIECFLHGTNPAMQTELPIFNAMDLVGIPITEEWLIKFGFIKDHHGYRLEDLCSLSITINKYGDFLPCFNDRVLHNELKLKEVHQLQNMYFALTGQELTYTP